jgi:hypothetical protein
MWGKQHIRTFCKSGKTVSPVGTISHILVTEYLILWSYIDSFSSPKELEVLLSVIFCLAVAFFTTMLTILPVFYKDSESGLFCSRAVIVVAQILPFLTILFGWGGALPASYEIFRLLCIYVSSVLVPYMSLVYILCQKSYSKKCGYLAFVFLLWDVCANIFTPSKYDPMRRFLDYVLCDALYPLAVIAFLMHLANESKGEETKGFFKEVGSFINNVLCKNVRGGMFEPLSTICKIAMLAFVIIVVFIVFF